MLVFEDLKYTEGHLWVRIEENIATIGLTDFGQTLLGNLLSIDLPDEGEEFIKDDVFATVEGKRGFMELYTPLTGKVVEIHDSLIDEPDLVNSDPYEDGWLIRLEFSQPEELEELLMADDYESIVEELKLTQEEDDDMDFEEEYDE